MPPQCEQSSCPCDKRGQLFKITRWVRYENTYASLRYALVTVSEGLPHTSSSFSSWCLCSTICHCNVLNSRVAIAVHFESMVARCVQLELCESLDNIVQFGAGQRVQVKAFEVIRGYEWTVPRRGRGNSRGLMRGHADSFDDVIFGKLRSDGAWRHFRG